MDLQDGIETSESRFAAYVETLASALGHADRVAPLKAYCTGLLLPGERKSVERMAARVEPGRVQAAHQSLHRFVAKADWSDDAVLSMPNGSSKASADSSCRLTPMRAMTG